VKALAYHITWGTYGTRPHGDPRGTVNRADSKHRSPILGYDEHLWEEQKSNLLFPPVRFTRKQRIEVERIVPEVCERGYWKYHVCAAGPDHVHVILTSQNNPETIRRLLKRWIGQQLHESFPLPKDATFWSECGSIRWIGNQAYFDRAIDYVRRQRATEDGSGTTRLT
jgi:REP element-mobilizing transposase RayT